MFVLRGAVFLALGAFLDPCSKLGIKSEPPAASTQVSAASAAPMTGEQVTIEEAKKLCSHGDCMTAHDRLEMALPPTSAFRQTPEFKNIQNAWAKAAIEGASGDPDAPARKKVLEDVLASNVVDPAYKTQAREALKALAEHATAQAAAAVDAGAPPDPKAAIKTEKTEKTEKSDRHRSRSRHSKEKE